MNKISIKIQILDRTFPLSIEQENKYIADKSISLINEKIKFYQLQYKDLDKQNILSMVLIDFVLSLSKINSELTKSTKHMSQLIDLIQTNI